MIPKDQVTFLSKLENLPSFRQTIQSHNKQLDSINIDIFQINVGKLCNMTCQHCHVEAGPDRTELMTKHTFDACLKALHSCDPDVIDLTGGAPEMNPHLAWFITEVSKLNKRIIVRSNLTILKVPKYAKFIDIFTDNRVEVVASVPDYGPEKTNKQRGSLTFERSIEILQKLNDKGYGKKDSGLTLNLVHNPVGAFLPGSQHALEYEYKTRFKQHYAIEFNHLFCITNMPISRYLDYLIKTDNYEDYMSTLVNAFNLNALDNVMCRNTLSIGWDGYLYDCDFNQMLDLKVAAPLPQHIDDFDYTALKKRSIVMNNHCYGCTAGAGSSCQGELSHA